VAQAIESEVSEANGVGVLSRAFAARYGGEEFAVVVPCGTEKIICDLAHSIVSRVHALSIPHLTNAQWGMVTISLGVAYLQSAQGELKQLFRLADARLYGAKNAGRNRAQLV
jgi:diguanylate cyclase (GGDEF)-like protein